MRFDAADVIKIVAPGLGATVQDRGRHRWGQFGVPPSGAMDDHAAAWANRLLDNPIDAPLIELLLQGAVLSVLKDTWIAITGADMQASHPRWRALRLSAGEEIRFPLHQQGVWTYVAVEGGVDAPRWLRSASVYPRGGIGQSLQPGEILRRAAGHEFHLPEHVGGRIAPWIEQRTYSKPPVTRVWPGPQWDSFTKAERNKFFKQEWKVTPQSDRVGYRLAGEPLLSVQQQIISEPVVVGTLQVPDNGQPIVTLRDGPTVGGYPKLGLVDAADISWLVQCSPGQSVRFRPANEI